MQGFLRSWEGTRSGWKRPCEVFRGGCRTIARDLPDHPGEPFHTSSVRISYLCPARVDGGVTLSVNLLHASRSVVLADVQMYNPDGKTATRAHCTLHRTATEL